jgi:hypothetical protein
MKIRIVLSCIASILIYSGCKDHFLDKFPNGRISTENFYKTSADAVSAINAVYDPLQWRNMYGVAEWAIGDVVSDDSEKGGNGGNDFIDLGRMEEFNGTAVNDLLNFRWKNSYTGILRANTVLKKVPDIPMDNDLKQRILGEALFLRALYYFGLVKVFGDIPLWTEAEMTDDLAPTVMKPQKTAATTVYARIEADLRQAAAVLPLTYDATETGRATKGAATGLLAKVYLYQKKWPQAEEKATEVINSGKYDLVPDYNSNFTPAGENNIESVFEIQHSPNGNGWSNEHEGSIIDVFQSPKTGDVPWFGWGFNLPTENFVRAFEPGDPRIRTTVMQKGDTIFKGIKGSEWPYGFSKKDNMPYQYEGWSPTGYNARKYVRSYADASNKDQADSPVNIKVIRFSDILLMQAEALAEQGKTDAALIPLNRVRQRVKLPKVTTTRQTEVIDAIRHERRVELGLEGHRFFDLVRWSIAGKVMRAQGKAFVDGKHELFPIPQQQLDLNPNLTQNLAWQ